MRRASAWLGAVAAAHREQADTRTARGATVRRVTGGANKVVYRVEADGEHFACKLCVDDGRTRYETRNWTTSWPDFPRA